MYISEFLFGQGKPRISQSVENAKEEYKNKNYFYFPDIFSFDLTSFYVPLLVFVHKGHAVCQNILGSDYWRNAASLVSFLSLSP